MSSFIETEIDGASILVETNQEDEMIIDQDYGARSKRVTFEEAIENSKRAIRQAIDSYNDLNLSEMEVTFGIKIGLKAGIAFWGIAEVNSDSNFSITLKWKKE